MVFSNLLPDVVLFVGLILGLLIGYRKGFVRVLLSGLFKRIVALVSAILLAKPIGRLIAKRFLFGGIADWIEKALAKALGENTASLTGETVNGELPRVARWLIDLLNVDTDAIVSGSEGEGEALIRAISEKLATPVANFFGVLIAVFVLYFFFRLAFGLIRGVLDRIMSLPGLVIVNKVLGVVAGFAFSVLFLWLILSVYAAIGAHNAGEPGFFMEFDLEKTFAAKYLSGNRPIDFVFSVK